MIDQLIRVYDDVLDDNEFQKMHHEVIESNRLWNEGGRSADKNEQAHHWHMSRQYHRNTNEGQPPLTLEETIEFGKNYPGIDSVWVKVLSRIRENYDWKPSLRRAYSNMNAYGMEGQIHTDDGVLTAIYYPSKHWNINWEGGTCFYDMKRTDVIKYVAYRPNRLVIFTAQIPHRAMPVTRDCFSPRVSLIFKIDKAPA